MKAVVQHANPNRGMFAAEIEGHGEYVVFELLDSIDINQGDVISHRDFYSMGGETYKNLSQQCTMDVFVENVCGIHQLRSCLLM